MAATAVGKEEDPVGVVEGGRVGRPAVVIGRRDELAAELGDDSDETFVKAEQLASLSSASL